jgi:uncharacterized protein YegL
VELGCSGCSGIEVWGRLTIYRNDIRRPDHPFNRRRCMAKKAKAKPTPSSSTSPTLVTFVLDRSSSMTHCWDSTIEAFNGYVDGLRDTPQIDFTLVQFDHHGGVMDLNKVCVATPIKDAPKLTRENYVPRGSTPLIDAAYTVIKAVETSLLDKPKDTKVVICIQTDGEENCSRTYNWEQLASLVKEKQEAGWQFNFMGAGIDAYQQGARMGFSASNTVSYNHMDAEATRSTFGVRAQSYSNYASGVSANTQFTAAEKLAAGDKFDPAAGAGSLVSKVVVGGPATPSGFSLGGAGQSFQHGKLPLTPLQKRMQSGGPGIQLDLTNRSSGSTSDVKKEAFKL